MSLRNILERELVWASSETSVRELADLMHSNNVGCIVICDEEGKPTGIVTDRDIVLRAVRKGSEIKLSVANDVMTKKLITAPIDCGIYDVIHLMKENEIRRVPVVDPSGVCVGLLSFGDMLALVGTELNELVESTIPKNPKLVSKVA